MLPDPAGVTREANRLYWKTDASVAEIAERLGLSRRALYEVLGPELTGRPCPACGGTLSFANRLARAAGAAVCSGCGHKHALDSPAALAVAEPSVAEPREREPLEREAGASSPASPIEDPEEELPPDVEQELDAGPLAPLDTDAALARARSLSLGGGLVLGVLAGTVAALLFRPRRGS